jgi:CBS domain containing-hemolysin-like protein/mannitol/fructose-specific phosphotransferase system IIA component
MTIPLIAALVFLFLNVFFVLAEFSLVRTLPARMEIMLSKGVNRAGLVLKILKHLERYLSAIQVGVTACTLGLGWLGEPAVARFVARLAGDEGPLALHAHAVGTVVSFLVITYFQVVFAELVPRNIAIQKAESLALLLAYPLEIYKRVVQVPSWFLAKSSSMILRVLGLAPAGEVEQVYSEAEVRVMLSSSQEKGLLPLDRLLLIENLFDLTTLKVRDAMVPRDKIVYLSTAKTWDENVAILRGHHFSRYPLADPDLDHITGLIHVKDLGAFSGEPLLADIKRRIATVQDSEPLQPLLKTMATQGKHMMIAMRGLRVAGLITLEDVLEEVVGEIHDEFDVPTAWTLHGMLAPELIDLDLKASTPRETVESLSLRVKATHGVDPLPLVRAVLDRESQLPTAIGQGVAVPHARLPTIGKPIIAVGRANRPLAFNAPDKVPVRLVFLILTPASAPLEQLRILSRVATLVNNQTLRRGLMRAKNATQFLDIVRTSEALVAG